MSYATGFVERLEHSSQIDPIVLRGLPGAAKQAVARFFQFRVRFNEILDDIGNVPYHPHAHLELSRNLLQLALEDLAIGREHAFDLVRIAGIVRSASAGPPLPPP